VTLCVTSEGQRVGLGYPLAVVMSAYRDLQAKFRDLAEEYGVA
jgi:hypothetical protein